jgi:hypothetical protein
VDTNIYITISFYILIAVLVALSIAKLYMVYFSDEAITRRKAKRRKRKMHKKRHRHHRSSNPVETNVHKI